MRRTWLTLAVILLGFPRSSATAQGVPRLDSTVLAPVTGAGQFLLHWSTDEGANGEQSIYLKNTSKTRSITITSWEVYNCYRVATGICGPRDTGPTIKPGKSVRLVTIRGFRGSTEGFQYGYRFTQRWTDELTPPP